MSLDGFLELRAEPERLPISAQLKEALGAAYLSGDIASSFAALAEAIDELDERTTLALVKAQCESPIAAEHFPIANEVQSDLNDYFAISLDSVSVADVLTRLIGVISSLEMRISQNRRDLAGLISELRQAGLSVSELED
ncbi:hypothetical protein [Dietzia maris]|uniref:hypothetical protein n=1 Tax=Dietzia maris TaxID=37915 RepID=UPI00223A81B1|nr:hypothetical protein [Dietzia maris]MCT1434329.1 hypothetical protein [Dietzia maris]MCT1521285.1 hypothetical protein [Dietzia maris]